MTASFERRPVMLNGCDMVVFTAGAGNPLAYFYGHFDVDVSCGAPRRRLRAKTYRVVNPEGAELSGECAGLMAFDAGTSMPRE